MAIIKTIAFY